ncbi:hypothetical protein HAX54_001953, partial [Datura stramonium]|nr:hypothetical protein [Datura stramonium]
MADPHSLYRSRCNDHPSTATKTLRESAGVLCLDLGDGVGAAVSTSPLSIRYWDCQSPRDRGTSHRHLGNLFHYRDLEVAQPHVPMDLSSLCYAPRQVPRERGDDMIACNVPFDPLRVKGASGAEGRRERWTHIMRTLRDRMALQEDLEVKKKRHSRDNVFVRIWKGVKKILKNICPRSRMPKQHDRERVEREQRRRVRPTDFQSRLLGGSRSQYQGGPSRFPVPPLSSDESDYGAPTEPGEGEGRLLVSHMVVRTTRSEIVRLGGRVLCLAFSIAIAARQTTVVFFLGSPLQLHPSLCIPSRLQLCPISIESICFP